MTTPLYAALARVAEQTRTPLVDVRALFASHSPNQITGDKMLLDHIHPTISGHQLIAHALLEQMAVQRLVTPRADWEKSRELLFQEHLATLDAIYYAQGKQRFEGLIRWTQGRASKLNPATSDQRGQDDVEPIDSNAPDTSDQNADSRLPAKAPGND